MNIEITESDKKKYSGVIMCVLALTALIAPFYLFLGFLVAGIAILAWWYLDELKAKKALAEVKQ